MKENISSTSTRYVADDEIEENAAARAVEAEGRRTMKRITIKITNAETGDEYFSYPDHAVRDGFLATLSEAVQTMILDELAAIEAGETDE